MSSLALSLAVLAAVAGYSVTEACGASGLQCIEDQATCVGDTCVCDNPPYVWGDGWFACYRQNQVAAESRNDPSVTTFNNETVDFPYPCRYLATHVSQELKDRSRTVIGVCEFKISVFNARHKGKIYTHGLDIAVAINYNNGTTVARSVRKYGVASNGVNDFYASGRQVFAPDGAFEPSETIDYEDAVNGIELKCFEDEPNNQLVFELNACGLRVTFVPYDIVLGRDQPQIPGSSIGINCAHHPEWQSNDVVVGLAPSWQGGQLLADIVLPGLTKSQSLVDRAFRQGTAQVQPDAHPRCADAGAVLDACTDTTRALAYDSCYWILTESRFIKCIHGIGQDFVDFFVRCVDAWCGSGDCAQIITDIGSCSATSGIPELDQFVSGALCPP